MLFLRISCLVLAGHGHSGGVACVALHNLTADDEVGGLVGMGPMV